MCSIYLYLSQLFLYCRVLPILLYLRNVSFMCWLQVVAVVYQHMCERGVFTFSKIDFWPFPLSFFFQVPEPGFPGGRRRHPPGGALKVRRGAHLPDWGAFLRSSDSHIKIYLFEKLVPRIVSNVAYEEFCLAALGQKKSFWPFEKLFLSLSRLFLPS